MTKTKGLSQEKQCDIHVVVKSFYCKGVIHYPELGDEPCKNICDDCKGV
jgi:hypothetical protein